MINVKTQTGRLIHVGTSVYEQYPGDFSLSADVLCNRVPRWHGFAKTEEEPTCKDCIRRRDRIRGAA